MSTTTETQEYAEMLMERYASRVLTYLKTLSMETLMVVGRRPDDGTMPDYFWDEIKKYGCE